MKKYLSYILILAVLAGLFIPVVEVNAQTPPLGNCTWPSSVVKNSRGQNQTISAGQAPMTHNDCDKHTPPGTWVGPDVAGPVGTCTWPSSTVTNSRGQSQTISAGQTQMTKNDCDKHLPPGTWASTDVTGPIGNCTWSSSTVINSRGQSQIIAAGQDLMTKSNCDKHVPPGVWNPDPSQTRGTSTTGPTPPKVYVLLAPLPCDNSTPGCVNGKITTFDPALPNGLGRYLNMMIMIFIGICAILSVVMIILGGLQYMTSELVHSKEAGKEKIEHAILGLLIALGAYALLFTINPDLLKSDLNLTTNTPPATITPTPTTTASVNWNKNEGSLGNCVLESTDPQHGGMTNLTSTENECYSFENMTMTVRNWDINPNALGDCTIEDSDGYIETRVNSEGECYALLTAPH